MTLQLTIDGVDFTAKWRLYESSWSLRAWQGEGALSSFILDDIDGSIDHANLAAKKIVEVWEGASGSNKCMYRGRVANKTLGMAPQQAPGVAMRWTVLTEDYNVDLKGIEVQGWERTEETDDERVEALRLDFLNGGASVSPRARTTTNLDGTYIGSDPLDAAPLFDETYTDTDPLSVLTRIVEMTGRVFFVYLTDAGDGELVYFNRASDSSDLLSDIEIRDDGQNEGVDDISIFAPYRGPQAGDHGGQNILTGGSVRYMGGGYVRDSDVDGREAIYDKWETSLRNDNIRREEAAQDFLEANVDASEETFTYLATIDMRAEYAHLIRAGMRVRIKRQRANQTTSQQLLVVTSEHKPIKPDADAEAIYQVSLEIGRPLNPHFTRSRFHIPLPPSQGVEGACQRLYFSLGAPSFVPGYSAVWNTASPTGDFNNESLTSAPDNSYGTGGGSGSTSSTGGSGNDILLTQNVFTVTAGMAEILEAGGTVRMQARARSRSGVGISEAAQDNISQLVVRVFQSGGSLRGTAYAGHSLSSSAGSTKWPAQTAHLNRKLPPAAASNAFSAVAGTIAGDKLVVEAGYRSFTVGTTGAALKTTSGAASDLPEDELEGSDLNAWIAFCSEGSTGDVGEPGTLPGDEQVGGSGVWADADHSHPHGKLADDGVHMHDLEQIQAHSELTHSERVNSPPTITDDEDAGWDEGDNWVDMSTGEAWVLVDATAGAAVWEQYVPNGSSVSVLDDLTDVVISTPADGEVLTYDSGTSEWINATATGGGGASPGQVLAAVVYRTAALNSSAAGGGAAIAWDTEERDDGGFWASGNPTRLTIPTTGWYNVGGTVGITNNQDSHFLTVRKNGSTGIVSGRDYETTNGVELFADANRPHYFTAADYVELIYEDGSASAFSVGSASNMNFWIYKVGGNLPLPWAIMPTYGGGRGAASSTGAANRAVAVPVWIPADCTITGVRLRIENSTGNGDVGIYDSTLTRLGSNGGAAWAGTGVQTINFSSPVAVAAGRYYLGVAASSATATFAASNVGDISQPINAKFMDTAYPLPSTFTSAGETSKNIIAVGIISGISY